MLFAAAAAEAVAAVSSLDDVLPILRDLFDKLSDKADRGVIKPVLERVAALGASLALSWPYNSHIVLFALQPDSMRCNLLLSSCNAPAALTLLHVRHDIL